MPLAAHGFRIRICAIPGGGFRHFIQTEMRFSKSIFSGETFLDYPYLSVQTNTFFSYFIIPVMSSHDLIYTILSFLS